MRDVHRHAGGLEIGSSKEDVGIRVHRHAGGLENPRYILSVINCVHRHAGGLENLILSQKNEHMVHRHAGGLENSIRNLDKHSIVHCHISGLVRHDKITRCLCAQDDTSKDLWHQVKSIVRKIERDDAALILLSQFKKKRERMKVS